MSNPTTFGDPTLRKMNEILLGATTFRFDGSDLMPGARGRGVVLDRHGRLRRWQADAADVAAEIQASWDAIK